MKRVLASLALAGGLALGGPMAAEAQRFPGQGYSSQWSPSEARDARERGQTIPLKDVFKMLKARYGGYQLDADLYSSRGGLEYHISWMTKDGRKIDLVVDARTGQIRGERGA